MADIPRIRYLNLELPLAVQFGRANACSNYVCIDGRPAGVTFRAFSTSYLRFGLDLGTPSGACGAGPGSLSFTGQLTALAESVPIVCMPPGSPQNIVGHYQVIAHRVNGVVYVSVTHWGNGPKVAYGLTFTSDSGFATFRLSLGTGTLEIVDTTDIAGISDVAWVAQAFTNLHAPLSSVASTILHDREGRSLVDATRISMAGAVPLSLMDFKNLHLGDIVYITVNAGLAVGTHAAMVVATSPYVHLIHEDGHRHTLDNLGVPSSRVVAWLDVEHAGDAARPGIKGTCSSDVMYSWMLCPNEISKVRLRRLYDRDAIVVAEGTPKLPAGTIILRFGQERGFLDVRTFRTRVSELAADRPLALIASHVLHLAKVASDGTEESVKEGFQQFRAVAASGTTVNDVGDLQHLWLADDVSTGAFSPPSSKVIDCKDAYNVIFEAYTRAEQWHNAIDLHSGNTTRRVRSVLSNFQVTGAWPFPDYSFDRQAVTVADSAIEASAGRFNSTVHIVRPGTAALVRSDYDPRGLFASSVNEGKRRRVGGKATNSCPPWDA